MLYNLIFALHDMQGVNHSTLDFFADYIANTYGSVAEQYLRSLCKPHNGRTAIIGWGASAVDRDKNVKEIHNTILDLARLR